MKSIDFEGMNAVYAKDHPVYNPLQAYVDESGCVVSCWQLDEDDLRKINETKVIWVSMLTFRKPLQPIRLDVERPPIMDGEQT